MKKFIGWCIILNFIPLFVVYILSHNDKPFNFICYYIDGWIMQITIGIGLLLFIGIVRIIAWLFE